MKTKEKILNHALLLFNIKGVADVSIRQIAKEAGISHGNLIYHYRSKSEIVQGIHQMLLEKAIELNENIDKSRFDFSELFRATKDGFQVAYEFRFLFMELLYIVKKDSTMLGIIKNVEYVRSAMYREVIQLSIENGLMKKESFQNQYNLLIDRIKIYSDHWLASAAIYDDFDAKPDFNKYTLLFMDQFYMYLTDKGRENYNKQQLAKL